MLALGPGAMVGGYRIEETLGRGGDGHRVPRPPARARPRRRAQGDRSRARQDPTARARFVREARAAAAVEHPAIVPVYQAAVQDEVAYVVMRYVRGSDLRTLVRRDGPLEPAYAAEIVVRLGGALDAIHAAGYVHRDVKPANVLIGEGGEAYLSDFGLAKHLLTDATQTEPDRWVGTVDFAAPGADPRRPRRRPHRRLCAGRGAVLHALRPRPVRARDRRGAHVGAARRAAARPVGGAARAPAGFR